jgi:hypothetical protein
MHIAGRFLTGLIVLAGLGWMIYSLGRQLAQATDSLDKDIEAATDVAQAQRALTQDLLALELEIDSLTAEAPKRALVDSLFELQGHGMALVAQLDSLITHATSLGPGDASAGYWFGTDSAAHAGRGNGAAYQLRRSIEAYVSHVERVNVHFSSTWHTPPTRLTQAYFPQETFVHHRNVLSWERYYFGREPATAREALSALRQEALDLLYAELKWVKAWQPGPGVPHASIGY